MPPPSIPPLTESQLWRILSEPDFFRLIFDALPLQVAVKSTRPETFGRILLWNRVAEEWMGLRAEDVVGRTDYDFFPKEQADFFQAKDREVVASRQVVDIPREPILSRVHGERFLHTVKTPIFDGKGEPLALLAVSEDITERVRAEERQGAAMTKLRETEERWQLAIASTEAGVWDWNVRTGELFYSGRWRALFGYEHRETPRTPREVLDLVHPDDRARVRRETQRLLRRKSALFRCEYRMRRADGIYLWILAHAKAQFDAKGRATRMIGTLSDISERKRVEAQVVEAKEAAERANQAKSDFLAMMSHEIRTPLNGVLGFADLLAETALASRQREFVQVIRQSGANLLHVLNDILDYSKIESGKLALDAQPAALRELLAAAVETFRASANAKQIELVCEMDAALPEVVLVDAVRLRQVLTNLVSNAVKFTERGCVSLRATVEGLVDDHVEAVFFVADTGIGIPAEAAARLFEPFEQLDGSMARRFGGTGLGLAIVRRLVGMMNGRILLESEHGRGSTFTVSLRLPVISATADSLVSAPAVKPTRASQALSILIVEDNAVNRRLVRLMLERLGYAPDEAPDGPAAVENAGRRAYDVVLMDIQMPGMDGYEAAKKIRELRPRAQIVALTAHALPGDRARSSAEGMRAHLAKPVRSDELHSVLLECAAFQKSLPA
jgi:PAS domain S-box-containing protein